MRSRVKPCTEILIIAGFDMDMDIIPKKYLGTHPLQKKGGKPFVLTTKCLKESFISEDSATKHLFSKDGLQKTHLISEATLSVIYACMINNPK